MVARPRPVAGRTRRARPAPVCEPLAPARAHAALSPTDARKPPRQVATVAKAEPTQQEGATLPTVSTDGPLLKCVDGLRGVVSRWQRAGLGTLALASFTRLSGAAAPVHAGTVELHRGRVEAWLRRSAGP